MIKTILLDQNTFDKHYNRNIDTKDIVGYLKNHKKQVYLLKNLDKDVEFNIPNNINGVIEYDKDEIRHDSYNLIMRFISESNIKSVEELLIVTSDQELIKVFDTTSLNTCLIYKNLYDYMEVNPTYEFNEQDKIKKLI